MGKFLPKRTGKATSKNTSHSSAEVNKDLGLYKPIDAFKWKDAPQAEIHQNSIDAYKKYAF